MLCNGVSLYTFADRWQKPCREQYMTDQYFADYQVEMSSIIYTHNGEAAALCATEKDPDDSDTDDADWIPLSEFSRKVNNRKNGHGSRRLVSALRQLRQKYLTRTGETLTKDDSSVLLAGAYAVDDVVDNE